MRKFVQATVFATAIATISAATPGLFAQSGAGSTELNLPTSKQLVLGVPGDPRRTNSLPMSLAISPDGRWIAALNGGYGTLESGYMQSIGVMDAQTGQVKDFPDARTLVDAKQTFFSGLAFRPDGQELYAGIASSTNPLGDGKQATGNGIAIYSFDAGVLKPKRFVKLPWVKLPAGARTDYMEKEGGEFAIPYPSALAVLPGSCAVGVGGCEHTHLLVAENLSDSVSELDLATGVDCQAFQPELWPAHSLHVSDRACDHPRWRPRVCCPMELQRDRRVRYAFRCR